MSYSLTTGQAALVGQIASDTGTAIETGISLPGQSPSSLPGIQAYANLNSHIKSTSTAEIMRAYGPIIKDLGVAGVPDATWINVASFGTGFAQSGVIDYSGGHVRYFKDAFGWVQMDGLLLAPSSPLGLIAFTLPAGYRPATKLIFMVVSTTGVVGTVGIDTTGAVTVILMTGSILYSMTSIRFKV